MTATTTAAHVLCTTSGCGALATYLDMTVRERAAWIEVRTAGRPGRWYCTPVCAAAALHPDGAGSLVLRWEGTVDVPGPDDPAGSGCQVHLVTAGGGPAPLALDGEQRHALAGLLDSEIHDITRDCPTVGCGTEDGEHPGSVPWGWIRLQVAGTATGLLWYCGPVCVGVAMARGGTELAEEDQLEAAHGAGTVADGGAQW